MHQYRYNALLLLPYFFFHTSFFISSIQNIYSNSLSITIPPFSGICFSSFIFNMFGIFKQSISKRLTTTSLLHNSKKRTPSTSASVTVPTTVFIAIYFVIRVTVIRICGMWYLFSLWNLSDSWISGSLSSKDTLPDCHPFREIRPLSFKDAQPDCLPIR